jgi:hypothetical protein
LNLGLHIGRASCASPTFMNWWHFTLFGALWRWCDCTSHHRVATIFTVTNNYCICQKASIKNNFPWRMLLTNVNQWQIKVHMVCDRAYSDLGVFLMWLYNLRKIGKHCFCSYGC